ncbi:MAG: SufD family Fe-S cluster assembly protein, partial [Gammaproteobacteria bacterium]|nr:SufD family Fe-S cluster assembly protein [Gammaproteobacteria bacterium]
LGQAQVFTNAVIEVRIGAAAQLAHMRLQLHAGAARSLTAMDVAVARDGRYDLQQALLGSIFRRNEIRIHCTEPGAEVTVGAATLTRDRNHLDTQMCLEHEAPHCTSNQVFRALAGERSKTVLNGRIHIHPDAQKTSAELSSRNLLLSHDAEIDAKPELEIYADDVKCAHGATIGRLDEKSLFYLRSRGVKEDAARLMLSFAFLAGVVDAFPLETVRDAVRPALEAAFMAPGAVA